MEFDVGLYPEGGSNSLHTQNPEDENFLTILAMTEKARDSPLTMKVTIKEAHHGKLKWERRRFEGTLLVFHFQFKSKVEGRRYRKASVTLEFDDPSGKASYDPAIVRVAPSPARDRYLNRTEWSRERKVGANVSIMPSWVDLGGTFENTDTKPVRFSARLIVDTHWSDKKSSGPENAVTWSMEENTGEEDGIPSFLQAAVLLRRVTAQPFRVQLRVTSEVDWKSNTRRRLRLRSDVDKIIDPILLTPGTAQEGVNNSDITAITDKDLLAMEELPVTNYYKIFHPVAEY
ncbi:hypothetical protein EKO27_g6305 [Xylaria grammica]|uniref:Uncharacterized protein n=1 Tax=Xylaria grammica TaxID=363999 RepID=A0A439D2W7_9PEZI|nr:hypothetical protein EKO27_g6305 [Xylaria grammica]